MINAIIKGIFFLITKLFTFIFTPVLALVTRSLPDLSTAFAYIAQYFSYGFTYIRSISRLLLIPDNLYVFLFDYFIVCNTIFYGILIYRFALNVYQKFKL